MPGECMDNFRAVYKILTQLEKDMDLPHPQIEKIDHTALGVSENRWMCYMEMMEDCGYIKGAFIMTDITGEKTCDCTNIQITLKGLEYLQENSIMRKLFYAARDIKSVTPGI